ncbi:hypothetical protein N7489_004768 [Penicillium chrysogenum]|uniref:uncharacterized protein n=1 Tax=Penicillium chrysogenum TaxID=5076 RepID=UPI0024DF0D1D|nr:uncharacterized protein N7489_004768 [Penicillium chrysogenum]KAJ5244672.1 hypothetical protein N7489_004768 [Penicillium chrysogenum]
MPKYEDSRADPKDEEQKQARLSKSTPIGEDGKPYVEWDFNVWFIRPQCRPLDSASTLASASQITHLLQKYTKCRSRYILSYPLAKKRLKFKGYSTGELFGVGCLNLVSIDADYEVHGRKDQIVAQRRLKTSYAHRSTAALTTGKPVTLTWYSDSNFTKWDFICCDEQQLPVAKFTLKIWGVRKLGRIKFMGPMAHNQKLQEEIVVTSLTLSYQMAAEASEQPANGTQLQSAI